MVKTLAWGLGGLLFLALWIGGTVTGPADPTAVAIEPQDTAESLAKYEECVERARNSYLSERSSEYKETALEVCDVLNEHRRRYPLDT